MAYFGLGIEKDYYDNSWFLLKMKKRFENKYFDTKKIANALKHKYLPLLLHKEKIDDLVETGSIGGIRWIVYMFWKRIHNMNTNKVYYYVYDYYVDEV